MSNEFDKSLWLDRPERQNSEQLRLPSFCPQCNGKGMIGASGEHYCAECGLAIKATGEIRRLNPVALNRLRKKLGTSSAIAHERTDVKPWVRKALAQYEENVKGSRIFRSPDGTIQIGGSGTGLLRTPRDEVSSPIGNLEDSKVAMAISPDMLEEYPTLVHWTRPQSVQTVLQNGLQPASETGAVGPEYPEGPEGPAVRTLNPRPGCVYLTEEGSATGTEMMDRGYEPLYINTALLDPEKFVADEDLFAMEADDHFYGEEELPVEDYYPDRGQWADANSEMIDSYEATEESLGLLGNVAYRGTIPPEAIRTESDYSPKTAGTPDLSQFGKEAASTVDPAWALWQPMTDIADTSRWMFGDCAAWAAAYVEKYPQLRFAVEWHLEELDPEDAGFEGEEDWVAEHVYAHDDIYAYDARGTHLREDIDDQGEETQVDWDFSFEQMMATGLYEGGVVEEASEWIDETGYSDQYRVSKVADFDPSLWGEVEEKPDQESMMFCPLCGNSDPNALIIITENFMGTPETGCFNCGQCSYEHEGTIHSYGMSQVWWEEAKRAQDPNWMPPEAWHRLWDENSGAGKTAGLTLSQEKKLWATMSDVFYANAEPIYNWDSGWTAWQMTGGEATDAVGRMLRNCWQGRDDSDGHVAVTDENGIPRLAMYVRDGNMSRILGRNNRNITEEYFGILKQMADDLGLNMGTEQNFMFNREDQVPYEPRFVEPPRAEEDTSFACPNCGRQNGSDGSITLQTPQGIACTACGVMSSFDESGTPVFQNLLNLDGFNMDILNAMDRDHGAAPGMIADALGHIQQNLTPDIDFKTAEFDPSLWGETERQPYAQHDLAWCPNCNESDQNMVVNGALGVTACLSCNNVTVDGFVMPMDDGEKKKWREFIDTDKFRESRAANSIQDSGLQMWELRVPYVVSRQNPLAWEVGSPGDVHYDLLYNMTENGTIEIRNEDWAQGEINFMPDGSNYRFNDPTFYNSALPQEVREGITAEAVAKFQDLLASRRTSAFDPSIWGDVPKPNLNQLRNDPCPNCGSSTGFSFIHKRSYGGQVWYCPDCKTWSRVVSDGIETHEYPELTHSECERFRKNIEETHDSEVVTPRTADFDPSVWETPKQPVEQEKLLDNKLRGAVSWMEEVTCDECGGPAVLATHPDYPDDEGHTFCIDNDCVAGGVASENTLQQVRSAPFHDWKGKAHESAMTNKKLNEMAANLQPDRSQVVHDFGDGWTIRQPTVVGDVDRVGKLMENCWDMRNKHADPDNYGGQYDDMSPYLYEGWQEFLSIDKPINAPVQRWLADPQGIPRAAWRDNEGKAEEVLGRHNSPPQKKYLDKITEVYPDYRDPTFGLFAPYVDQRRQPVKDDTNYGPCSVCGSTETIITQPENMRFCHQCHALEDMEENLPDWRPRIITDLDEEGVHNWEQNYHQIVLGDEWWGWDEQKTASRYDGGMYDDYGGHVEPWRPGAYGKGFIDNAGRIYLWEVTDWNEYESRRGQPHHEEVFLGTIGEGDDGFYGAPIWIDPEGRYTSSHPINMSISDESYLDDPSSDPEDLQYAQEVPGLTHIPSARQWVEMQGSNPDQGGFGHAQNVMDILNKKSDFDPDLWTHYDIRSENQMELGDIGDDLDLLMGNDYVIHECPDCGGSAVGLAPTEYAPSTVIWCEDCHGLFTYPSPGEAYTKEKDLDPETAKQFGWVAAMEEAKNNLWENIWTDRISAASNIGVIEADFPLENHHTGLDYGQRRPFLYSPKSSSILLGPAGAVHAEVAAWLETPEAQAVTGGISFWPWRAGEIHTYSNWDEMNAQSPLDMGPQPPPEVLYNDKDAEAVKQALAPYTQG